MPGKGYVGQTKLNKRDKSQSPIAKGMQRLLTGNAAGNQRKPGQGGKGTTGKPVQPNQKARAAQDMGRPTMRRDVTRHISNQDKGPILRKGGDMGRMEALLRWLQEVPEVTEDQAYAGGYAQEDYGEDMPWEDWGGGGGGSDYVPQWYSNLFNLNVNR